LGHSTLAASLQTQVAALRARFEELFWCEDLSIYALALDGAKRPCRVISSNAGQVLFSGITSPERAQRVSNALLSPSIFSGWGIRTIAVSEARYNPMSYHNGSVWPHDNALIALGMARYAQKGAVCEIFSALVDAASYMDLRRLPELFCGFVRRQRNAPTQYPVACSPQAWASATMPCLLQAALGLELLHASREVVFHRPVLPLFIDHVHLRNLQLGGGSVDVLVERHADSVAVKVTRQAGGLLVVVRH